LKRAATRRVRQLEPEPGVSLEPEPNRVEVEVFLANERLGDPCGEAFPVTRTVEADDAVRSTSATSSFWRHAAATHGLYCRDLRYGWPPTAGRGLGADAGFLWSVVYWNLEGQPERMDADGNGIPCETLYTPELIEAVLLDIGP
jgi:hypothetical protein